jgi:hypothetical protein
MGTQGTRTSGGAGMGSQARTDADVQALCSMPQCVEPLEQSAQLGAKARYAASARLLPLVCLCFGRRIGSRRSGRVSAAKLMKALACMRKSGHKCTCACVHAAALCERVSRCCAETLLSVALQCARLANACASARACARESSYSACVRALATLALLLHCADNGANGSQKGYFL